MELKISLVIVVVERPALPAPPPKPEENNDWIAIILSLTSFVEALPPETKVWLIDQAHHWLPWTHWLF